VAFGVLVKMETATKYYWELKAIDSIITFTNTKLPGQERQGIIDTLIDNQEIKIYL
jgi:hypothetical protein